MVPGGLTEADVQLLLDAVSDATFACASIVSAYLAFKIGVAVYRYMRRSF